MYVSNEERMRLGLQQYGSDVPTDVYMKAIGKENEPVIKEAKKAKVKTEED